MKRRTGNWLGHIRQTVSRVWRGIRQWCGDASYERYARAHDLRSLLRENASDEDLAIYIRSVVNEKEKGHRINEPDFVPPSRTMVFIGG